LFDVDLCGCSFKNTLLPADEIVCNMDNKSQQLPAKEAGLFKQVVKFYETKHYKKGIKAADQVSSHQIYRFLTPLGASSISVSIVVLIRLHINGHKSALVHQTQVIFVSPGKRARLRQTSTAISKARIFKCLGYCYLGEQRPLQRR